MLNKYRLTVVRRDGRVSEQTILAFSLADAQRVAAGRLQRGGYAIAAVELI